MHVLISVLVVFTFAHSDDDLLRLKKTNSALRQALASLTSREISVGAGTELAVGSYRCDKRENNHAKNKQIDDWCKSVGDFTHCDATLRHCVKGTEKSVGQRITDWSRLNGLLTQRDDCGKIHRESTCVNDNRCRWSSLTDRCTLNAASESGIEKALAEPRFCAENHDCPGGVCLFGKCKDLFPEGAVCADDRDCASGRCSWNVCLQGKSVPEGAVCADDSDCASGRCSWNVCLQGEKAVGEVDCDTVRKCQVCTDADHDHKCIWMNSDCYVLEEVQDRWFAREDYNDVFAVHADECPAGLDSLSDEDWCERRQRAGAYIYGSNPPTREYVPCEPFDVEKCPNLCAELAANGMKPVPDACWHYSSAGVDLAPGEWDGYDRTNVHDCVNRAESAGVHLFAWTGEVYSGYCKVLKKSVTKPNLDTNQGYGYRLFGNTCGSSATSAGIRAEKMVAGETVQGDVTYIYRDGESYIFMNLDTYEEIAVNSKVVGENKHWLVENKSYKLTLSNGNPIAVTPPNFLELEVVETAPGSTGGKSATLSTGAVVWVPLFIHNGDVVKVDTRTASYVSLV